jgi:hypothetical protein
VYSRTLARLITLKDGPHRTARQAGGEPPHRAPRRVSSARGRRDAGRAPGAGTDSSRQGPRGRRNRRRVRVMEWRAQSC